MHDCNYFQWPATNEDFWKKKILSNVARDKLVYSKLTAMGWQYLVVWECELKDKKLSSTWDTITYFLNN